MFTAFHLTVEYGDNILLQCAIEFFTFAPHLWACTGRHSAMRPMWLQWFVHGGLPRARRCDRATKELNAEGGVASVRRLGTSITSWCYCFHCLPRMCAGVSRIIVNTWWMRQELLGALNKSNRDSREYTANKWQLSKPKQTRRAATFACIVNVQRVKIVHDTQSHTIPHSERYYLTLSQPTPF